MRINSTWQESWDKEETIVEKEEVLGCEVEETASGGKKARIPASRLKTLLLRKSRNCANSCTFPRVSRTALRH